jgi:hypothetical protein
VARLDQASWAWIKSVVTDDVGRAGNYEANRDVVGFKLAPRQVTEDPRGRISAGTRGVDGGCVLLLLLALMYSRTCLRMLI